MDSTTGKPVVSTANNPYAVFGLEPTTEKPTQPGWYIVKMFRDSTSYEIVKLFDGSQISIPGLARDSRHTTSIYEYWLGPLPEVAFPK